MSQSSETTKPEAFLELGYELGAYTTYYAAKLSTHIGVICFDSSHNGGITCVQFFQWGYCEKNIAHAQYADYVMHRMRGGETKTSKIIHEHNAILPGHADILTIKCVIEDAHSKILEKLNGHHHTV